MSRTNISILLATALLGVLLFLLRQIFDQQPVAPVAVPVVAEPPPAAAPAPPPPATDDAPAAPAGPPLLDGPAALRALLENRGLDADAELAATQGWFEALGFTDGGPLRELLPESSTRRQYASLDELTLQVMSDGGDPLASEELAARRRFSDSFDALAFYSRAARQGSVKAALQLASLNQELAQIDPEDFGADDEFLQRLQRQRGSGAQPRLQIEAYETLLTAMRDGGPPVIDDDLLDWAEGLAAGLPPEELQRACNRSFDDYVRLLGLRRVRDGKPVTIEPPPVFLAPPDLDARMPCQESLNPIGTTLQLDNCGTEVVIDARGREQLLYLCPAP